MVSGEKNQRFGKGQNERKEGRENKRRRIRGWRR